MSMLQSASHLMPLKWILIVALLVVIVGAIVYVRSARKRKPDAPQR